ncbi:MAG TPA: hypothetical protein PKG90_11235 [Chitinophagaceae bacterium]|nr:hypothetical protein [Chitinophagaceae bacterium]
MKTYLLIVIAFCNSLNACSQNKSGSAAESKTKVGGNCEGCEAIYESPVPFEKLNWIDTLPDFNDPGSKLEISGIVYKKDGKTPAAGVVIYIYHTDQKGVYPVKGDEKGWDKRHGYIRGWVKTNDKGQYRFYTLVPASYPNSNNPKHIHPVIKESDKNEYWIDEFLFADDPLLPIKERNKITFRGGSGILVTVNNNGLLRAQRNIILGENIPGYPKQ